MPPISSSAADLRHHRRRSPPPPPISAASADLRRLRRRYPPPMPPISAAADLRPLRRPSDTCMEKGTWSGSRMVAMLMAFIMTIYAIFREIGNRWMWNLPVTTLEPVHQDSTPLIEPVTRDEFHPPAPAIEFRQADLLPSVLKKLDELEDRAIVLQSKPSRMPLEKEELLDAAVRRVDALEAELIATKECLHEALIRQDELLAYIDREEEAKLRKMKKKKRFLCFLQKMKKKRRFLCF